MNADLEPYLAFGRELMRRCMAEDDTTELHLWASNTLAALHGGIPEGDGALLWPDSFAFYDAILAKRAAEHALPPHERKALTWPWPSWNRLLDPLPGGMLAVLSAGDGQGKTAYAECIAEHWAQMRARVVFVHYELNHAVMMDRRYARHTGLTIRELKAPMADEQRRRVMEAHARLRQWQGNITYQHAAGWTMEQTLGRLKEYRAGDKCDVVILDYLEKNAASRRQVSLYGTNTWQREADNVELLKSWAEAHEVPVVMLTQMSKKYKGADVEDLDRTAMRGAGEKSEKANVVVLLHRERDKAAGSYSPTVDVRVDKNTLGPTGGFSQYMAAEYFRVHDIE